MSLDTDMYANVPLIIRRVMNRIGKPVGVNPFPRVFHYDLAGENTQQTFDAIYQKNHWGSDESASGVGSEILATARYRRSLAALIRARNLTSMFDAPCGDLHWMPLLLKETQIAYLGGDVSPLVVAGANARHPELAVRTFDLTRDAFPKADVWHCRDCLFHLPFADIRAALHNFAASRIPYALLTTHRARLLHKNLDVRKVGFRYLDLERPPFNLPRALTYLPDYRFGAEFPRYVGLWSNQMIAQAL